MSSSLLIFIGWAAQNGERGTARMAGECKCNQPLQPSINRRIAGETGGHEGMNPADQLHALAEDIRAYAAKFDITPPHESGSAEG
jgi:hypothetical protein